VQTYLAESLSDPGSPNALVEAVMWLQTTILGTVATTIAVIAIASVGLMMLSGRLNFRRGATVAMGCFILFDASTIATGIRSVMVETDAPYDPMRIAFPEAEGPLQPTRPPPSSESYDPYAGAAVP
jgi:type IV secretory pathway VirB2 component (pilin)